MAIESMQAAGLSPRSPDFAGYYGSARLALLDLLDHTAPRQALELGCGSGANLAALRQRHPACATTGVEVHAAAAAAAAARDEIDRIVCADLLDRNLVDLPAGSFDLVIMSHVLEHFVEPVTVVERALNWLAPGGRLLVALPNIRHASVLFDLVVKRDFRYQPAGVLDRTHLRFYTRKSALRWFDELGLRVLRCAPDIDGRQSRLLLWCSLGLARDLSAFAYNFLLCRK